MALRKYPPHGAAETIESLAIKGWSTIGIAKHFGISQSLVRRWFDDYENLQDAYEQGRDSYRQALEEQIIQMTLAGRNPSGLIYLLKSKFKMWDVPSSKPDPNINVTVAPVMVMTDHGTNKEWEAKAAEQQRRLTADAQPRPVTLLPPIDTPMLSESVPVASSFGPPLLKLPEQPKFTAPAWTPPAMLWDAPK